jgi:hypothetical protein
VNYFTLATFSGRAAATRPREGPMVRIHLPPAVSQLRTKVLRLRLRVLGTRIYSHPRPRGAVPTTPTTLRSPRPNGLAAAVGDGLAAVMPREVSGDPPP